MKKTTKLVSTSLIAALALLSSVHTANYVSAATTQNQISSSDVKQNNITPRHMTDEEVQRLVNELHSKYPEFSEEYITDLVNDRLNGNYSIPSTQKAATQSSRFNSRLLVKKGGKWKGISVKTAALAIDTTIGVLLPGGGGSIALKLVRVGRHEANRIIKIAIIKTLGASAGWLANYVVNALDPGMAAAKLWDAHDKYPHNGYINF